MGVVSAAITVHSNCIWCFRLTMMKSILDGAAEKQDQRMAMVSFFII